MKHEDVIQAVDSGDILTLKYIFCDCLDGDPTFEEYEEDYQYCLDSGKLFVPHVELNPMVLSNVNEEYWVQLKNDFMQNPSKERMEHMREVAKVLYKERIDAKNKAKAKATVVEPPKVDIPVQPEKSTSDEVTTSKNTGESASGNTTSTTPPKSDPPKYNIKGTNPSGNASNANRSNASRGTSSGNTSTNGRIVSERSAHQDTPLVQPPKGNEPKKEVGMKDLLPILIIIVSIIILVMLIKGCSN